MTRLTGETVLESRLRAALADASPIGGAPAALRSRVDAIPHTAPHRSLVRRMWTATIANLTVAGATGVAALALLAVVARPAVLTSAGSGASPGPTFDPASMPGLVTSIIPTLQFVPLVSIAFSFFAAANALARLRWRRTRSSLAQLGLFAALGVGSLGLMVHPGPSWQGGTYGPVLGFKIESGPAPGSDAETAFYETTNPGDPVMIVITATNPGPLPIRLEGLYGSVEPEARFTRWVGIARDLDPGDSLPTNVDQLRQFEPVDIAPGERVDLYMVGRAGACAYGPGFTLDAPDVSSYINVGGSVGLVYSVFGLVWISPFELPMTIVEPLRADCPM